MQLIKKISALLWPIIIFSCAQESYFDSHAYITNANSKLLPFDQIKAPNFVLPNEELDKGQQPINTPTWGFQQNYPYVISASPYYCDPVRYPPSLVLGMYACQPYIPQILQMGFPHSIVPGFN